jgi:hypothetical protein
MIKNKLQTKGKVKLQCFDKDGKLKWTVNTHNLIVSAGKAAMAGLVGNTGAITAFTYLAVGTSNTAVAVGQTALQAEISTNGLSRTAATVSRVTTTVTNDTLQLIVTWTVSGSSTVEEIGVFNASSSGIMLGRALTTSKAVSNGDTLVGTYQVIFA